MFTNIAFGFLLPSLFTLGLFAAAVSPSTAVEGTWDTCRTRLKFELGSYVYAEECNQGGQGGSCNEGDCVQYIWNEGSTYYYKSMCDDEDPENCSGVMWQNGATQGFACNQPEDFCQPDDCDYALDATGNCFDLCCCGCHPE